MTEEITASDASAPLAYLIAAERDSGLSFRRGFYGSLAKADEAVGRLDSPRGVRYFAAEIREVKR
ncbi:hypothetical protein [Nocardia sp. NPDC052566]|uniref:hypothetical protein n=1 Tax=Nocardia sp. NPDC052566 TaxID=3364330 RepID=UPI0037CA8313